MTEILKPSRPDKTEPGPDAKCERVVFRVTRSERADLDAAAAGAGKTFSDYVRMRVMNDGLSDHTVTPRQVGRDVDMQAIAALNRTGLSLLQMAERLSAVGAPVPKDLDEAVSDVRYAIALLVGRR